MTPLAAAALGALLGCAAGLLPGLHANTLVALLAATAPDPVLLAALAGSHALLAILPATYLGVPAETGHLGVLPAHRLLLDGRGRDAVRIAAAATLGATAGTVPLLLPFKWLWAEPGEAGRLLAPAIPWLLAAVPAWLAWRERRRGWRAVAWGLATFALAGLLGLLAGRVRAGSPLPIPPSPLGALLSGLFGGAGLLAAALGGRRLPTQGEPRPLAKATRRRSIAGALAGVLASAATALVPGATPALVASATPPARRPEAAVASLAAVGAAQPVFALALLWLTGQARSGLALGVAAVAPVQPWSSGRAPTLLLEALAAWLAAATVGYALLLLLEGRVARWLPRLPQVPLAWAAFVLLAVLALLVAGPVGLLLFAAGTVTGLLPLAAGVRRVHLTGALLLPLLAGG